MADSTQLFIDIQTNMLKTLQDSQKSLDKMGDLLTENQKKFSGIDKTGEKIVDSYSDIEKHQKSWNKGLDVSSKLTDKIKSTLSGIAGIFGGIFAGISLVGALKSAMELNEEMIDLSFRMGQAGKSVKQLTTAVHSTVQATGLAGEKASELVGELVRLRVPIKDLETLSIASARFTKITGLSVSTTARLTGELSKTGKLGADGIGRVMLSMAKMQRLVGLTEGEMEQLAETTVKTTRLLGQMGKTQGDIEKFSKGTAKLAASFSSVGVSAGEALRIVEELLDPSKIEDNAFMLAKLGVSMEDAFSGNVDPGALASRFKELGSEIKGMSGPAAAEMAKSLGMPLDSLRQMADMDLSKLEGALAATGGDWQAAMKSMQSEQAGPQEKLEDLANKTQDKLVSIMESLLPAINTMVNGLTKIFDVFTKLFDSFKNPLLIMGFIGLFVFAISKIKKRFYETNTEIARHLQTSMEKAVYMGTEKSAMIQEVKEKKLHNMIAEDRRKRIMETSAFSRKQTDGEYLEAVANSNTYFKGIINWSANITKQAAFGVKGNSFWLSLADSMGKKTRERLELNKIEGQQIIGMKNERLSGIQSELKLLENRKQKLSEMGELTTRQRDELNGINKAIEKRSKEELSIKDSLTETSKRYAEQGKALMGSMSGEELDKTIQMANARKDELTTNIKNMKIREQQLNIEQEANKKVQGALNSQIDILRNKKSLTAEEATSLMALNEQLEKSKGIGERINADLAENVVAYRDSIEEAAKLKKLSEEASVLKIGKDGDAGALKQYNSLFQKMRIAATGFKDNIVSSANAFGAKMKNSFANAKEALVEGFKNVGPYLRQLGGGGPLGILKGAGKAVTATPVGGLAAGGLGLLMGFLAKSEGFQKIVQKVMAAIQKPIESLFKAVDPLVQPLLGLVDVVFGRVIMPLLKTLAPILIKALGFMMWALGGILQGVGHLVKFLTRNTAILDIGTEISKAGKEIMGATLDFSDAVATNTDALEKNMEEGPAIVNATGSGFSMKSAAASVAPPTVAEKKQFDTQEKTASSASQTALATGEVNKKQDRLIALQETSTSLLVDVKKLLSVMVAQTAK